MTKRFVLVLAAFLMIGVQTFAQSVSGKVVDRSGEAIVGAGVQVKGTTNGVASDLDGAFTISGVNAKSVLVITSIGYKTAEVTVGAQKNITVTLDDDAMFLDDVVVVGYGTARKKDLSGAISSVKFGDKGLADIPNPNAMAALSSKVAGLTYSPTTSAGGDNTGSMTIRGRNIATTSRNTTVNKPLIVVDGVIFGGSINEIQNTDIENIDVLKDASAAAIYGSRAANGVIIITTKSGKSEKPVVSFSSTWSTSDWARMQPMQDDEETFMRNRFYSMQAAGTIANTETFKVGEYNQLLKGDELTAYQNGQFVNWMDEISRKAFGQKYDLSVSGGTKKANYYISGNYTRQQGILKGDDYSKYNVLAKVEARPKDWLNIGLRMNYLGSKSWGQKASLQAATWYSPYSFVMNQVEGYESWYNSKPDGTNASPYIGNQVGQSYLYTTNESQSANFNAVAFAQIDVPFIPGLSYRVTYSGRRGFSTSDLFNDPKFWVDTNNKSHMDNPSQFNNLVEGSSAANNSLSWSLDNIVTYNRDFGVNHFDAMVGYTREYSNSESLSTSFKGFSVPTTFGVYKQNLSTQENMGINRGRSMSSAIAYLARANYNYASKYYVNFTYRRDGYSAFAPGHKWGNFFGASAAWVVSSEEFMKGVDAIDFLKIRASWGQNGSRSISPYATVASLGTVLGGGSAYANTWFGDTASGSALGYVPTNLPNQSLTWATVEKYDLGIDFSVLESRINGNVDLYVGNTRDMLLNRSVPYPSGFNSSPDNAGLVTNKGIEITVNTININGDGNNTLRWTSDFVFDANRNKIVSLFGPNYKGEEADDLASWNVAPESAYALMVGKPISAVYDYNKLGIFQSQAEIDGYIDPETKQPIQPNAKPGDVKYEDHDHNGKIDTNDKYHIGDMDPIFTLNFANTFTWKNISLYFNLRWMQGSSKHFLGCDPYAFGTSMSGGNQLKAVKPWTEDNHTNKYPRYGYQNTEVYQWWNPRSFLKLNDLVLSYNFDKNILDHIGVSGLRVFVSGTNLLTFTNWSGHDPETGSTIAAGAASTRYIGTATYRTFQGGVNITF